MRMTITAQQSSFFTQNGYIEFGGIDFDLEALFKEHGRALWQKSPFIRALLMRKLGPIALTLSRQKRLRLGADWHITPQEMPKKMGPCSELFSVQGLQVGCAMVNETVALSPSPLGLLPIPSEKGHVLFFRTDLILDWPSCPPIDLYVAAFALPNAIYVENRKDPLGSELKKQGYFFGDPLRNDTHPLF